MALLSFRGYARHRGCRLQAVQNAIASQRITVVVDANGKRCIDPEIADAQWARNTDPVQQARAYGGSPPTVEIPVEPRQQPNGKDEQPRPAPPDTNRDGYLQSKRRRETAEAAIAELQLAKLRSELVLAADVKDATFKVFRALRDRVLMVPDRITLIVRAAASDAAGYKIMADELKEALRWVPTSFDGAESTDKGGKRMTKADDLPTDELEQLVAEYRGKLANAADQKQTLRLLLVHIEEELVSMSARIAPLTAAERNPDKIRAIWRAEMKPIVDKLDAFLRTCTDRGRA